VPTVIYSPDDKTADTRVVRTAFEDIGAEEKKSVANDQAGDILFPASTEPLVCSTVEFLTGLTSR